MAPGGRTSRGPRSFRLYVWLGAVDRRDPGASSGSSSAGRRRHGAARPARDPAARLGRRDPAARAGDPRGAARRALRRPPARHDHDLRRRRQLAGQPQAAARVGAARALRDRHRARRRGDRASRSSPTAPAGSGPRRRCAAATTGRVGRLRRLLVPVLEDALERSLALAAGMDTRGYGRAGGATAGERRTTGALMLARPLRHLRRRLRRASTTTAPRVLALPMLGAGRRRRGRRAGQRGPPGRSAPATGPTAWRWPELSWSPSGVVVARRRLVASAGTSSSVAYPAARRRARPLSLLALGGGAARRCCRRASRRRRPRAATRRPREVAA